MTLQKRIFSSLLSLIIMFGPGMVLAANLVQIVPDSCNGVGGCQTICDFSKLAQNILNDSIYFSIVVSAILFAYAGWQYVTAMGDPSKIKGAKNIFKYVIVGLCIIVGAWLIIDTILNVLTGTSGLQWNRIC